MKAFLKPLAAVVLLACPVLVPAFQDKASIEGRVVNAVSGDAVRRVNLTLLKIHGASQPLSGQTDGEGRFAFPNLEAGAYRLSGERPGFQKQVYGARLNPNTGSLLVVAAGQALRDITFKLAPDAVIAGRVLDQDGEPMPNLLVTVRRSSYSGSKRQWTQGGAMQTNDRGEFRIAGLRPGRYVVLASNMDIGIGLAGVSKEAPSDKPDVSYGSTYFGNTLELSRATPVDLSMGDDRRNINIQMIKTTTVRVKGKVVPPPEGNTLIVMLTRRESGGGEPPGNLSVAQSSDGSFEIRSVTPGSYVLTARNAADPLKSSGGMTVQVADRHLEGLELRLTPGAEVKGRVIAEKGKEQAGIAVSLDPANYQGGDAPTATAAETGAFVLKGVQPGLYRVRVTNIPEGLYLASATLGGQEVNENGTEFGAAGPELEIVLSRGGELEGVATLGGKPGSGALVALIPESRRDSRYASMTADEQGKFGFKGVAPGKYRVMAWEDIEAGAFRDPEFVKPFESRAVAVTVEANGQAKLNLTVIPFEEVAARERAQ